MFNNNTIEVTSYGILSDKVRDGIVIAHLSDLHEKEFGIKNHRLFEKVESLKPDIIAVTGDMVAHGKQKQVNRQYTREFARGIAQIAPAYFVTGNHEKNFCPVVEEIMDDYGIRVLTGGMQHIKVGDSILNISGMDDISYEDTDVFRSVDIFRDQEEGFNLFLAHRPEYYPVYLNKNIDLILAGHTHAGQVRFPKFGTFAMSGQGFMPKYLEGEFTDGVTTMIISRGLGSSGYPKIRINNPPDLVAVYVEPEPAEAMAMSV